MSGSSNIEKGGFVFALQDDVEAVEGGVGRVGVGHERLTRCCILNRRQQRIGGVGRPRANTATLMCGACNALPRPGTGPGLMVVTRKRPSASVATRPKPRNFGSSGLSA